MTRPKLGDYIQNREELLMRSNDVFKWVMNKDINVSIHKIFDLKNASLSHKGFIIFNFLEIQSGKSTGKILLNCIKKVLG
jgi:hypothetical protein